MKKMLFVFLLLLTATLGIGATTFTATTHCWRQEITRPVSPSMSGINYQISDSPDYDYVFSLGGTISFGNFGSYNYACDDGASGNTQNYFDLYDNKTGAILFTNSVGYNTGPNNSTSSWFCMRNGQICYIENGVYKPWGNGQCGQGDLVVGQGPNTSISIALTSDYLGEQDWSLRLGAISPAVSSPTDPRIMRIEKMRVKFFVGAPDTLLLFSPMPVQKMNSYNETGTTQKEIFFTLLSKANSNVVLNKYSLRCPQGVTCALQSGANGKPVYEGFTIVPNQAMIIPVMVSFNNSQIPKNFSIIMDLNYTSAQVGGESKAATSYPVTFESGLLDMQDFQVLVSNQAEQKYCVGADGTQGITGEAVAPRVNIFFGGDADPSGVSVQELISINECSPIDYNTGLPNPNWVYCSQKEFLVQLAERLGKYQINRKSIMQYEMNLQPELAEPLKVESGMLLGYTAYSRAQSIESSKISESINEISDVLFQKLGLQSQVYASVQSFKNLMPSITYKQTINGIPVEGKELSPGLYRINVDLNELYEITYSESFLFEPDNLTPNPALNITVSFEKLEDPSFDWFFYDDDETDSFNDLFANTGNPSKYQTNVINRGEVLYYNETNPANARLYKIFASPLLARITDQATGSDSLFEVEEYLKQDIFTFWTGIASTLGEGCEITSTNPVEKQLPYRVPDKNVSAVTAYDAFEIAELSSVKPNSVIYLETVLYLPIAGTIAGGNNSVVIHSPFKVYTKNGLVSQTSPYTAPVSKTTTPFVVETTTEKEALSLIFDHIRDGNICVSSSTGTGSNEWKLFWNQQKIIDELSKVKATITDATMCAARQDLSS